MSHSVTVNIHIREGAEPKVGRNGNTGTRWLDVDGNEAMSPSLFMPHDRRKAIAYLDALITAATEMRDAIATDAGLRPALAA